MNSASRWPVVQLSHRRSPLHTRISCSWDPERFAVAFYVISVIRQTCSSKRQWETWDRNIEDTAHLGCRFPLIHLIHQRIYKACYLNAIFFYQNDNTIHEYSCTLSTYPDSNYVQSSTQKVNEEAIFHIIIVLSVIDRNKSMQYSSLAVIFLVSDLAPSLRWGQRERPEVRLRFFR